MTWAGGMGVTATKCEFSHAGQGRYGSSPECGLDIEYEPNGTGAWGYGASHGRFNNCSFMYNRSFALASGVNTFFSVDNIFTGCAFTGPQSLWISSKGLKFRNCSITGVVSSRHAEPIANANQNNNNQTTFDHCNFYEQQNVTGMGVCSFSHTPNELVPGCPVPVHLYLINSIGARQEFISCQTHTNYTLKDAWIHGHDSINLQMFNKTLIYTLGMTNHGLNSCDCDHELSSMANCNFHGDANGNVVMSGGTTYGGLRNAPPHGGAGQYPWTHFGGAPPFGHHMYHGVEVADNLPTFDSLNHRNGGFSQVCCYTTMWSPVPKYEHLPDPNPVQLFTQWPPYIYSTLNGVQGFCLDPTLARMGRLNDLFGEINIYPNPASNSITIENVKTGSLIKIVNLIGGIIKIEKSDGSLQEINIKTFPPGIYFIYIDNIPAKKFVKI
jgi:hypothetical protein